MKTFEEWLQENHPEMIEEGRGKDFLKNLALWTSVLGAGAGIGAAGGYASPYLNQKYAALKDRAGDVVGIDHAGDVERAKEARAAKIADRLGTNRTGYGALGGALIAGGELLRSKLRKNRGYYS